VVEAIGALQRPQAGADHQHGARLKALERENRELRRANEILRKASSYLAPSRRVKPSACRAGRDTTLMPEISRMFEENFRVYGVRKV
jgi:hypothetical protein